MLLNEIGGQDYSGITHTTQRLEEKLRQQYKRKIKIEKDKTNRGNVIFFKCYELRRSFQRRAFCGVQKIASNIRDMTLFLPDATFQAEKEKLPEKPKLKDIFNGGVKTPDVLTHFLTHLVCSPDVRRGKSKIKQRRVDWSSY